MIGEKLKALRESRGYFQREVAAELRVDTAYVSKMEHNEKSVSKNHLKKLAKMFRVPEAELMAFWLADKVLNIIKDEDEKEEALKIAMLELKGKR
jgi:transcriptional regulator with XRE-family HTH domain